MDHFAHPHQVFYFEPFGGAHENHVLLQTGEHLFVQRAAYMGGHYSHNELRSRERFRNAGSRKNVFRQDDSRQEQPVFAIVSDAFSNGGFIGPQLDCVPDARQRDR